MMLWLALFLAASPAGARLRVAQAPEPRAPRATVARAGAERAARRALERLAKKKHPRLENPQARFELRYGADGGVEAWFDPDRAPAPKPARAAPDAAAAPEPAEPEAEAEP